MAVSKEHCCVCRERGGAAQCDNCGRRVCAQHECRNERTGVPLCRLCHHWLDLPTGEVLYAATGDGRDGVAARWSRSFDCPDCKQPMARGLVGRMSLDCCACCGGFWFDRTQLSSIISQYELYPSWHSLPVRMFPVHLPLSNGVCPGCRVKTLAVGTWDERRIEQCRRCMGLWLSPKPVDAVTRLIDLGRRSRVSMPAADDADKSDALRMAKSIARHVARWSAGNT